MHVKIAGSLADPELQQSLQALQPRAKDYTVYIVPGNGNKRTVEQNRMYRRLTQRMAHVLGKDVAYWNRFFVERFLGFDEVQNEDGYLRQVLVSTSSLTVAEFTSFLSACLAFAADHQVH